MNKIKAAIIEDEIPAGRLLHKMLSGLRPDWNIVVLPGSIEGSVKWFQEHPHPDIIFLDIQLTDGISFTFIEQAQPESMIIFTTAYDEYAIRAFTVNSIDYLLKPINRERLAEAIEKFERLTARYGNTALSNPSNELLNLLKNISNPEKKYRTRFLISGDEKLYTLQVEDIAYFYSENKITFAVTKEGKEHIIDLSLDKLSEQLNPDIFFRTNRQTLVSKLDAIGGSTRIGHSDIFAAEACEFNRSFLHMHPTMAVVLNIDADHLDCYKDIDEIEETFGQFLHLLPDNGVAIGKGTDERVVRQLSRLNCRTITFGLTADCDVHPAALTEDDNGYYTFDLCVQGNILAHVKMGVPGRFNVENGLAALTAAWVLIIILYIYKYLLFQST